MQLKTFLLGAATCLAASQASAALVHDQNVTNNVIMGTGIANGGFTVERANNAEVGLRARVRYDVATDLPTNDTNSNGDGTFNHAAGAPAAQPTRARWNFDWSANSDLSGTSGRSLADLTWTLGMDFDPSAAAAYTTLDLLGINFDHSFGNNGTAQSQGVEDIANMATLAANNNLMQNSWNLDFFDLGSFDPNASGDYSFYLEARDAAGALIARTDITVIVGDGATEIPEPGALALAGLALAGIGAARRRSR